MTVDHLTKLIQIAILSAIAYVLTLVAVPIIPMAPFLKLDLSDLPILVGTVALGIGSGISVAALTIVLHMLMTGFALPTVLGDVVLFISTVTVLLTVGTLVKWCRRRSRRGQKLLLIILLTFNLTVIMTVANLVAIPMYMKMTDLTIKLPVSKLILFGIVPFNIVKGVVIGIIFLWIYHSLAKSAYFRHLSTNS